MQRPNRWIEGLSIICLGDLAGVAGPAIFYLMTAITESLNPDYNPLSETVSALAIGPYGWIETVSFFLLSFLVLVFTTRLYQAISRSVSARIGIFSYLLISLGLLLVGIFPTGEPGAPETINTAIHNASAGGISVLFVIACFTFALEFRFKLGWRKLFLYTLLTGVIAVILIILSIIVPSDWD